MIEKNTAFFAPHGPFQNVALSDIRKKARLTKERFRNICSSFVEIVKRDMPVEDEEELQWI